MRQECADPMLPGAGRSSAANARREARASLAEPSRPFTPAQPRSLFHTSGAMGSSYSSQSAPPTTADLSSRPTSSFRIGRDLFDGSLAPPTRPTSVYGGAEVLQLDAPIPAPPSPMAAAAQASSSQSNSSSICGGSSGALPPPPAAPAAPPPPAAVGDRAETNENVMPVEQQAWWAETEGLLAELRPDTALEPLLRSCDALWERLREPASPAGPPGVPPVSGDELSARRKAILMASGGLMDRREPPLLLRLCRLILGARAERGAQLGACKLLFKLSKSESNDRRFRELGLLPQLLGVLAVEGKVRTLPS